MRKVFVILLCLISIIGWSCVSGTEVEETDGIGGRWKILSVDGQALDYDASIVIANLTHSATSENFPSKGVFGRYQCSTTGIKDCPVDFSDVIVFLDGHVDVPQWYTMTYPDLSGKKSTVKWRSLDRKTWNYVEGSEHTLVIQKQK